MKITICIGSSCHIKGSRQVVEQLQALVSEKGLMDRIELAGTFCIGQCQSGVNVMIDGQRFSVLRKPPLHFSIMKSCPGSAYKPRLRRCDGIHHIQKIKLPQLP